MIDKCNRSGSATSLNAISVLLKAALPEMGMAGESGSYPVSSVLSSHGLLPAAPSP